MASTEPDGFVTAAEACARLGIKPSTLYAYVSRGLLPSFREGIRRRRLYRLDDVERLSQVRPSASELESGPPPAPPKLPRAEDWIPFVN